MTTTMIITLAIVILMIVMIMSDKFAFGAPPLIACLLLVITGCATIPVAFAGFVDKNVIMIAGFMTVMAALQKTSLMNKIKRTMFNMASKGGVRNYVLLLLVVMIGCSVMSGTGYYVLVLSIVATIPYNKNLPTSRILMPLGFATGNPLIPVNMAFYVGMVSSLLESSGVVGAEMSMLPFSIMKLITSLVFLVWAVIGYRMLPDHAINDADASVSQEDEASLLPKWKETCTYVAFIATVVGCMFLSQLGDAGYAIPGLAAAFLFVINVLDFKEVRNNIGSPLVIMMAGVIGVAGALAESGFTSMVGEAVAAALGGTVNAFLIVLAFAVLTSLCSTFTGASIGSIFIFAPIGIAACVSMGLNPTALVVATVSAGWINYIMPIDGLPAMVMGLGKYKLVDFWKFTLPMYALQMLAMCAASVLLFPM